VTLLTTDKEDIPKFVFLPQPGPGGGGGGSPAPAPPKPMEVPKHKMPDPVPVQPVPTPPPPPPVPVPTLTAPVETNAANLIQATGNNLVSLAAYGGGGRGGGIGKGSGSGVGEGTGGGFGGGAYMPGNGVSDPVLVKKVEPQYTPEAMRAKIHGEVELEAVILPNGTVGDLRVSKSLDDKYGLDKAAMAAAKQWLFQPSMKDGQRVPVRVTLILTFRLY
jgi:protein TonB